MVATAILSISVTACRPPQNSNASNPSLTPSGVSHECTKSRSRSGSETQRGGAALHLVSARDQIHGGSARRPGVPENRREQQNAARFIALLPPAVLPIA